MRSECCEHGLALDEHPSRVTFDLASEGDAVDLTLTHDEFEPGSKLLEDCRSGWPAALSSLKSLLETGEPLAISATAGVADAAA
ncbi:SRPBCC domain-containing protein [Reyranella sp.]|uniref:SRPBCC domain-containing protein n=1 Tax=Reyranella sp. TaxID=1929291 RepID=UPI002F939684